MFFFNNASFPTLTMTKDDFYGHIYANFSINPSITSYFMERVSEGGDHHVALVFFQCARVFDPTFARTLTHQKAFELIGKLKLKHYPIICHGPTPICDIFCIHGMYHKYGRYAIQGSAAKCTPHIQSIPPLLPG
jgi:hypothetical protein